MFLFKWIFLKMFPIIDECTGNILHACGIKYSSTITQVYITFMCNLEVYDRFYFTLFFKKLIRHWISRLALWIYPRMENWFVSFLLFNDAACAVVFYVCGKRILAGLIVRWIGWFGLRAHWYLPNEHWGSGFSSRSRSGNLEPWTYSVFCSMDNLQQGNNKKKVWIGFPS